jgi:hypothetical protein
MALGEYAKYYDLLYAGKDYTAESGAGRTLPSGRHRGPLGLPRPPRGDHRSKHERRAELSKCIEDDFDPNAFDSDKPAEALAALAKRWSRKPAAARPA